jgi:ribosomal protein L13E
LADHWRESYVRSGIKSMKARTLGIVIDKSP